MKLKTDYNFIARYMEGIHGLSHVFRVIKVLEKICLLEEINKNLEKELLMCAIFHDIGRTDDSVDSAHGIKSFCILKSLSFWDSITLDKCRIKYLIENHCINDTKAYINVNKYTSSNIDQFIYLLKVFKDADNLDRYRIGDFDPKYLRLTSSQDLVSFAKSLQTEKIKQELIKKRIYGIIHQL